MRQSNLNYALYALFFILGLTFSKCSDTTSTVKVTIPKKEGVFIKTDTVYKTNVKTKFIYQKDTIELENPINLQLADEYIKQVDSIKRLKKYLKAIEEKEETYVFNNEDLKLEIATKTRGQILKITPNYTIHEQKIEVPQKKTTLALYLGAGMYNNVDMNNFGFKVDAGIQNKRGDLFTIGVDNRENIYLGVQTRILNIQK